MTIYTHTPVLGMVPTDVIDRDAAIHFIRAAAAAPQVTRFLMVSYIGSRRARPAWCSDDAWAAAQHVNEQVLPHYYRAKLAWTRCSTPSPRTREISLWASIGVDAAEGEEISG
ncbi:hypothetical protein B0J18DRAFT_422707 [Chaetomium sp. MPI-SDFR-AT-0129]|nr:hypothetical protein B0J18DRAFT_422707 [Chaetomium sp. MPI-SDFR-AT-0129]